MCGIFGQGTNNPKKINSSNIRILGMFNESRGKGSCGLTYDGEIYHGVTFAERLFTDFIKGRKIEPKIFPTIFGHTRTASVGAINEHNAHPFGFGMNERGDGYEFIGVHNGTILNYKELAEKHGVDLKAEYLNDKSEVTSREKIDSEVILEILYDKKNLKVLSDYNGRAALAFTNTNTPGVMYLFAGKSKPWSHSPEDKAEEERPLFVYTESKNCFYFSSIPDPLYAIGGTEDNVAQIDYNTVYIVKDGNFAAAEKILVSRINNFHIESFTNYAWQGGRHDYGGKSVSEIAAERRARVNTARGSEEDAYATRYEGIIDEREDFTAASVVGQRPSTRTIEQPTLDKELQQLRPIVNIYNDAPIQSIQSYAGKIYVHKFRYCRNGHPITGIFVDIPSFGLFFMGANDKEAIDRYNLCVGREFIDKNSEFDMKDKHASEGRIIFKDPTATPKFYYIINGIMLRTSKDYVAMRGEGAGMLKSHITASWASVHPVVNLERKISTAANQQIYYDGKLYTGEVDGLLFERVYIVADGNVVDSKLKPEFLPKRPKPNLSLAFKEIEGTTVKVINLPEVAGAKDLRLKEKDDYNPELFKHAQHFLKMNEKEIIEDEMLDEEFTEVEQMERKVTSAGGNDEPSQDDETQIIEAIIEQHFTPSLVSFQECRAKLTKFPSHPLGRETVRLIDSLEKLMYEFIKENSNNDE
jgi:glutamine amidotransferase-like protein